jgi:hypothetical protein
MRSAPGRLEREHFQPPSDTDTPFGTEKSSNLSIFRCLLLISTDYTPLQSLMLKTELAVIRVSSL